MNPGFYKLDDKTTVIYAPSTVSGPNYELDPKNKTKYKYPKEGWYWFDTKTEAYSFFKIELPKEE